MTNCNDNMASSRSGRKKISRGGSKGRNPRDNINQIRRVMKGRSDSSIKRNTIVPRHYISADAPTSESLVLFKVISS